MNLPFKKYLMFSIAKIKEENQFKIDFILSFFSIFISSIIFLFLFKNIFFNSKTINFKYMTGYYITVNIIFYSVSSAMYIAYNLMENINSGSIIPLLIQPVNYIFRIYMEAFGLFFIRLIINIIFIAAVKIFLLNSFSLSSILIGLFASILGFSILFFIQAIIGCFTVWFTDITRFRDCMYSVLLILGGKFFPVEYLYGSLKHMVKYTPIPYVFDTPARCFLEKISFSELQAQGLWFIILFSILFLLFNLKVKHNIEMGS